MGIGSQSLPAPQATLMSTIIKGLLSQNLPWGLVLVRRVDLDRRSSCAAFTRCRLPSGRTCRLRRRRPSSPAASCGGASSGRPACQEESDISAGTLFSSGLIAGGSLAGIVYAMLYGRNIVKAADDAATTGLIPFLHEGTMGEVAGIAIFFALAVVLFRAGQRKLA